MVLTIVALASSSMAFAMSHVSLLCPGTSPMDVLNTESTQHCQTLPDVNHHDVGESGLMLMVTTGGSYKPKYSNVKCSGGASADVTDIGGCQEAALQAGHIFYSFNSNNTECITASSCDIRVVTANTETYKQWIGAYNRTYAEKDSAVGAEGAVQPTAQVIGFQGITSFTEVSGTYCEGFPGGVLKTGYTKTSCMQACWDSATCIGFDWAATTTSEALDWCVLIQNGLTCQQAASTSWVHYTAPMMLRHLWLHSAPQISGCLSIHNVPINTLANGVLEAPDLSKQCTSCHESKSFALAQIGTKRGFCRTFGPSPDTICISLDDNTLVPTSNMANMSKLCTKTVRAQVTIAVSQLPSGPLATAFASVNGYSGNAVAECNVRKETICQNGSCDSEKTVTCHRVCKLAEQSTAVPNPWGPPRILDATQCDSAICEGEYAKLACADAAMME